MEGGGRRSAAAVTRARAWAGMEEARRSSAEWPSRARSPRTPPRVAAAGERYGRPRACHAAGPARAEGPGPIHPSPLVACSVLNPALARPLAPARPARRQPRARESRSIRGEKQPWEGRQGRTPPERKMRTALRRCAWRSSGRTRAWGRRPSRAPPPLLLLVALVALVKSPTAMEAA
ncbi:hypothetical protein PVAP13_9NG839800 [Panicum virgatum]|uniref:Uncharacterized protein n=1 Tax=Panicum virgatum TaxID=38727 RepID=A0A8T0MMF4_PANVG|nr:hypothetical protein PVAP13_9NG839800 [Panicum virgatum]